MRLEALKFAAFASFALFCVAAPGAAQMPDPKQMSGMPLPVGDIAAGTITVRVIRGQLTNPLPGQTVELTGAGESRRAETDEAGRAQFNAIPAGSRVKASVTVEGEKLESQEFTVPSTGGIRLMLVATDPASQKKAEQEKTLAQVPPITGTVLFGDQTRFVIEAGEEGLNVFTILQIVNASQTPVQTYAPLVFDLPSGASAASVLEGSAPNAVAAGKLVTISGPFPPGNTVVQFAYQLPFGDEAVAITQKLPAQLTQLSVIVQKIGNMRLSSAQLARQRDMTAEGQTYIVAQGPRIAAGDTLTLSLSGLPHGRAWPRNVALALSIAILGAGAWASLRKATPGAEVRTHRLEQRRERLLDDLSRLESHHREGAIEESRFLSRRQELVAALEVIYEQLDREAAA